MSMKPLTPMSQDSPPEHIFNVRNVETPSRPTTTRTKGKSKWRKLSHERSCDDCGNRLSAVIAFKQIPIGYCTHCEEEKVL